MQVYPEFNPKEHVMERNALQMVCSAPSISTTLPEPLVHIKLTPEQVIQVQQALAAIKASYWGKRVSK